MYAAGWAFARPGALNYRSPPDVVPWAPRTSGGRARFPSRWLCRRAAHSPHGRASAADVGRPHASALRAPRRPAAARPACASQALDRRAAAAHEAAAPLRALAGLARHRMALDESWLSRLARARSLRPRAGK